MRIILLCLSLWFMTAWIETVFFSSLSWLQPNLFLLTPIVFCLRRRGPETHFIFLFFGLTADSFSTLPFGIFGLSYFLLSFFIRWRAAAATLSNLMASAVSAAAVLSLNIFVSLILLIWFDEQTFNWKWLSGALLSQTLPAAVVAAPLNQWLAKIEQKAQVKPGEKPF